MSKPTDIVSDDRATSDARRRMVELIKRHAAATEAAGEPIAIDARVIEVMRRVPRHLFAPAHVRFEAYEDCPVPIGHRQTMSQPFIVALMSSLAKIAPGHRVLEVGTGSGYQAAVLAALAAEVYSIETIEPLARNARRVLQSLGITNVTTRIGDGHQGWPEKAPFDAIIVTAAAEEIPPPLIAQLKPGGRLVIPVGDTYQDLLVIEKAADGSTVTRTVIPVRFVPLVHGGGRGGPGA